MAKQNIAPDCSGLKGGKGHSLVFMYNGKKYELGSEDITVEMQDAAQGYRTIDNRIVGKVREWIIPLLILTMRTMPSGRRESGSFPPVCPYFSSSPCVPCRR